jgi:hypothetical protein
VDGQKVVDDRPLFRKPEKSVKKVSLKLDAGEHKIEMICDFNGGGPAPVLEFRPADQPLAAPMPMGAPPLDRAKD